MVSVLHLDLAALIFQQGVFHYDLKMPQLLDYAYEIGLVPEFPFSLDIELLHLSA